MHIMRTTVAIDDHLLAAAKARARERGLTLGQYLEEALRRELSRRDDQPSAPAPPIPVFTDGSGLRPGVDASSLRGLLAGLDEGVPIESLR